MNKKETKEIIQNYIEQGLLQEAEEVILQYKSIIGYDDEIASMEAILKIYNSNYDDALFCIRQGLKVNIFNGDLYFTMGNIYEMQGYCDKAYLCYEYAINYTDNQENKKIILATMDNLKSNYNIKVNSYSIIILTYNNLEYTKICIDSIKNYNSNDNCEIIIVDNNSTDGTVEWIKEQEGIKYILNEENKGFPAGCNQGIEISKNNNDIFLLNNDTVIMPNSIFNLRMGLYDNNNVGATGAVSNSISYYQQISEQYDNFDEYLNFALKNNITNEIEYEERVKLVGFAMLIKRNVLDEVGLLDERFTPGNFEDDDISFRILLKGYKLLLCKDSYIHHFGSVSFKKNGEQFNKLLKINSNKFKEKWGFVSQYSTSIRYDVMGLINEDKYNKMNVLEIGCACGSTLLAIKDKYPNSEIYGIEINQNSAKIAKCFADIRDENIENSELTYEEQFFDYIIFGDVLEHLYNPEKVLENIKKYLKDDGYILASIPNVMHHSVIRDLLNGNWTYQNAGILDRTHIRFFTKNEIVNMFNNKSYSNIELKYTSIHKTDDDEKFINEISKISENTVKEEFEAYQYLVKAKNETLQSKKDERRLTFLFRRLEFNIDIENSYEKLISGIKENKIKLNDIISVVNRDVINKIYIFNSIAIRCMENNKFEFVIPLLSEAYKFDTYNLDTNYNLAYFLNVIGEKNLAMEYLDKLIESNEKIDKLKLIIQGECL